MPFSFIEIEENKNRVIAAVFIFIISLYFLTAYLLLIVVENIFVLSVSEAQKSAFFLPPLSHALLALVIALTVVFIHWSISTSNLIGRVSLAIGAMPIDPKDTYHQYFKNIVDEVSVALGGRPIEAMVIPSLSLNAFSIENFDRLAVIGITEGLLSRLNRPQVEAVVAHEAGHIAAGDSLTTTVICSLSEIYEESLSKIKEGLKGARSRGALILLSILIVLGFMNFLSKLLRYFISRQREYRADAIAVRLVRDPLSLAEALGLISSHWRGAGAQGEKMESIFIVNPRYNNLDESDGLLSDIFSTHPPIKARINILLGMAHMDENTLEENLKNFKRVSPVAAVEFKPIDTTGEKRWFIFKEKNWLGPFLLDELKKSGTLKPDQWVRAEGQDAVIPAYEDEALNDLFVQGKEKEGVSLCPHCKTALRDINYEGVPVLKCSYCEGTFVEEDKISRIFIREDATFNEETQRLAQIILDSEDKFRLKNTDSRTVWVINCPKCKRTMRRQFFVYSYPVEIDRCSYCSGIWFDKQELELLQYIYERKEKFFDGEHF